jgi:hypothetical protein
MTVQTMDTVPTNDAPQEQQASGQEQSQQQAEKHQEGQQPGGEQQPGEGQVQSETVEQQQKNGGVQKRINELTRKVHEAEREAKFWREQHAAKQGATSSQDAPKPARTDFASEDEYLEAMTDWKVEQRFNAHKQQTAAERENEAQAKHQSTRIELYQQRVAESAESMPDFAEVVGASEVPTAEHVLESILDSEYGPQLAYHLAKDPDAIQRLNDMSPLQAAREIGRLEAKFGKPQSEQQPPQKRTTNAPAPINPVRGGNGQFTKAPEAMSDSEWFASRKT